MNLWLLGIFLCLLGAVIAVFYSVAEFSTRLIPKIWIIQLAVVSFLAGSALLLGGLLWEALA